MQKSLVRKGLVLGIMMLIIGISVIAANASIIEEDTITAPAKEASRNSINYNPTLEYYDICIHLHKISKIDDIEGFPGEDGADWYYHIGFSEDNINYYWESSPEPVKTNTDYLIVDQKHYYNSSQPIVGIAIMICEDDWWSYDDLADISSDPEGGQDNVADSIQPLSPDLYGGTFIGIYDVINDTLTGDDYVKVGQWYRTSGEYDNNSGDENDVEIIFNVLCFVDTIPPNVAITHPEKGIYLLGNKIISFTTTIIIGDISIEVNASDEDSGIERVEFYIDDEVYDIVYTYPYRCLWNKIAFFSHSITAIAYDTEGNNEKDEILVWKFF